MSVATWGQAAAGRTPTQVKQLRASRAAATGITQSRRCPFAAIWLSYGLKQDPLARLIKDTVSMWVTLWKELAEHKRMDTRKA